MRSLTIVLTAILATSNTLAFAPPSSLSTRIQSGSSRRIPQQKQNNEVSSSSSITQHAMITELVTDVPSMLNTASSTIDTISSTDTVTSTSNLLSFSDQGQNLAGIFFQASLLPYLTFLYFLSFRGNRTPNLGNFGWQYLLLFVLGTIPSGIITKSAYGETLANVDWLHGGAEALLTVTNVLIVLGFREAMTNPSYTTDGSKYGKWTPKVMAGVIALAFAAACSLGTSLGFEVHSPFLFGVGNLPEETVLSLPFGTYVTSYKCVMLLCFSTVCNILCFFFHQNSHAFRAS